MLEWAGISLAVAVLLASALRFVYLIYRNEGVAFESGFQELKETKDPLLTRYLQILGYGWSPLCSLRGYAW